MDIIPEEPVESHGTGITAGASVEAGDDEGGALQVEGGDRGEDGCQKIRRGNYCSCRQTGRCTNAVTETVLDNPDMARQLVAYAGERWLHLAPISKSMKATMRAVFEDTKTKESEIIFSVSCTLEALGAGWNVSPRTLRLAAAAGQVDVLEVFQCIGVSWCDGMFAAAVENEQEDGVLVWLMEHECSLDSMGLKALEVAIREDSSKLVACCFLEDVEFADRARANQLATARLKAALQDRELEMVGPLSRFVTIQYGWLDERCYDYARSGDGVMLAGLQEYVTEDDNLHVLYNTLVYAAVQGHFDVVSQGLGWHWTKNGFEGSRRNVPNTVLYCVARNGSLGMLQWCRERCGVVSADFCSHCFDVEGWGRVVEHAAGAGHVDMVLWCLENGWEYSEAIMQSAASEGRRDVVRALEKRALEERGYSWVVKIGESAQPSDEGDMFWDKNNSPRCEC